MNEQTARRPDDAAGPFYISATASLAESRPRTLKAGDTFAVFGHNGDVTSGPGSAEGVYHRDTRYLSRLDLSVNGTRPMLLSAAVSDDNAMLTCDLANPDLPGAGGAGLDQSEIHIRRSKFLWHGTCQERLALRNFSGRAQHITLAVGFAADFADLFEVRGTKRQRRGRMLAAKREPGAVTLAYVGLDGVKRATRLSFDPAPDRLDGRHATFELDLPAGGAAVMTCAACCIEGEAPPPASPSFIPEMRAARRHLRRAREHSAVIETDNEIFNEAMRRARADLVMLVTDTSHGPYPYAGIPWFSTVFGRDGLITALETLWLAPDLARGVLAYLAANQATEEDPAADADPGKILHEVRHGEMALLGEVPFRRYYGAVDSTPLFVMLAGAYLDRTGDLPTLRALWPNLEAALGWIDRYGDADGDGFVEYGRQSKQGLVNQGWKDSHDSIFHQDGRLAQGPIALAEVQAYVFAAKCAASRIAAALGDAVRAAALAAAAADLRAAFDRSFWDEGLGLYVLALDGEKRPCRVRASNAGHALLGGIALPERAGQIAAQLLGRGFFSGWGIRTVAVGEARFNPMSYHDGSVWPHDNALIALGLGRYGLREAAARVFTGMFAAAAAADLRRLPELFCGFPRLGGQGPTAYPVACAPQAWAAGALPALLDSCLGLRFDPAGRTVTFDHPVLPEFLDRLHIRGLALGDARIDVELRRANGAVAMGVTGRGGDIRAVMVS
ncbi:MAG TPA: amylo-alpha-1,6-glucosidase [Acetobacteraceae bacterium]|nr:amylo-alpha-1,6-glucosidase [Acetobacteraceae bacterium]